MKKRLVPEGGDPNLAQILSTELGFAYFYEHLRQEYSEENLVCCIIGFSFLAVQMCYQAINQFTKSPSVFKMKEIVDRYVNWSAPLEINIEADTRSVMMKRVAFICARCMRRRAALENAAKWSQHHDPEQYRNVFDDIRVRTR